MDEATSSQTPRFLLLTVIFAVTPWLIANFTFTRTSWPPRNTPDRSSMCELFLVSTVSERSHGCMPIKEINCFTASVKYRINTTWIDDGYIQKLPVMSFIEESVNVSSTWFSSPTSSQLTAKFGLTSRCTWSASDTSTFSN